MASPDMKLKTLYVRDILNMYSDEEHYLNASDIIRHLSHYGLTSDRRSIYDDIEVLTRYGMDIEKAPGNRGWYVASRSFELPELKMLTDAVSVAKFISRKQTSAIIKQLSLLADSHHANELNRQVLFPDSVKNDAISPYYAIDAIYAAIRSNVKLEFQYTELQPDKTLKPKKNGALYQISPWGVIWSEERYYMLGYDPGINGIKHYRVDRIRRAVPIYDVPREGKDVFERYRRGFTKRTFGMFGGRDEKVKLICKNYLAGIIADRFGYDVMMLKRDDDSFSVNVTVSLSPQFYGWLASLGDSAELVSPQSVKDDYLNYLKNICSIYEL